MHIGIDRHRPLVERKPWNYVKCSAGPDVPEAVLNKNKNVIKALSFGPPPSYASSSGAGTYYCVSSAMSKVWKKVWGTICNACFALHMSWVKGFET